MAYSVIRAEEAYLSTWFAKKSRKPLMLRGARQVGKSTLVETFAGKQGLDLAVINLDRHPLLNDVFATKDPAKILPELEVIAGKKLTGGKQLLFLDEIQATPLAIPALRYFFEDMPQLAVIAAGSLLEFTLSEHGFSMPVGRIEYLHMGPLKFTEFLRAMKDDFLLQVMREWHQTEFSVTAHTKLLDRLRQFMFIGGLPEAVASFAQEESFIAVRSIQQSILQTYQDDFSKYAKPARINILHKILQILPRIVGQKVKYTNIDRDLRAADVRLMLDLLVKARLLLPVYHSNASGLPIRAEIDDRVLKLFALDVGVLSYLARIEWPDIAHRDETALVNEGSLAEQFVAQHLAYGSAGAEPPELYYWLREGRSNNAEVDFLTHLRGRVVPIEVKAGQKGTLQSLMEFVHQKNSHVALRFDLNRPSLQDLSVTRAGKNIKTRMLSLPIYMAEFSAEKLAQI